MCHTLWSETVAFLLPHRSTTFKRLTKRENVKGRLDFDGSDATANLDKPIVEEVSTSESDKEGDIFDIDLPNLDAFGANFSFSELLIDLDLDCQGIDCFCPPILDASTDNMSGYVLVGHSL